MIPNLDIYRSANVIINQHGQDAPIHAAMRAMVAGVTDKLWDMKVDWCCEWRCPL